MEPTEGSVTEGSRLVVERKAFIKLECVQYFLFLIALERSS